MPIIQRIINKGVYGKLDTIVVHPIKALSNDQFLQIKRFAEPCGITVGLLTGDTTEEDKRKLFEKTPEILCTNFDSIYAHLLHDSRFSPFFQNFNTIIVDEIHYYGGIHGSNVNHVLATLKRNNPKLQMIGASATIDNLDNYAKKFFDNKNVEIIKSNQKNGKTNFAMISPIGIPFTALLIQFCKRLKQRGIQFLIFWDSKQGVEKFAWRAKKEGLEILPHRAGLKPDEREEIENKLKAKKLDGLISTPTLELGIDIGSLEVVFSILVPWSQFKQRMGRAGRRGQLGTGILILGEDPVSNWFKKHPEDYKTKHLVHINPKNRRVSKFMFPFRVLNTNETKNNFFKNDEKFYLKNKKIFSEKKLFFEDKNLLKPYSDNIRDHCKPYNIRMMGGEVKIFEMPFEGWTGKYETLKSVGFENIPLAYQRFHVGYIYMHKTQTYVITETHMNPNDDNAETPHYVLVKKVNSNYYTRTQYNKKPTIVEESEQKRKTVGNMQVLHTELDIDKTVFAYGKFNLYNDKPIGESVPVNGETFKFETKGVVLPFSITKEDYHLKQKTIRSEPKMSPVINDEVIKGLHAIEHLLQSAGVTIVGMSPQDLDGIYESEKAVRCSVCEKDNMYEIIACPKCNSETIYESSEKVKEKFGESGKVRERTINMTRCATCQYKIDIKSNSKGFRCDDCKKEFSSFEEMKIKRKIYICDDSGDGESGVTEAVYHNIDEVFRRAFEIVSTDHYAQDGEKCEADDGCSNCTFLMLKCTQFNENLYKPEAIRFLEKIVLEIFKEKLDQIKYEKSSKEGKKENIKKLREDYEELLHVKKEIDELEDEINDEY